MVACACLLVCSRECVLLECLLGCLFVFVRVCVCCLPEFACLVFVCFRVFEFAWLFGCLLVRVLPCFLDCLLACLFVCLSLHVCLVVVWLRLLDCLGVCV